jgi:shikimate dehydrogenase
MLVARLAVVAPGCTLRVGPATTDGIDLLVNASPVGMKPDDGLPAPIGELDPHVIVADVVLKDETPLLRHARACGCATVRGRDMMLGQVDEMLAFFGMG